MVDLEIPLLLALPSLSMLNCQIDFGKKRLVSPDGRFTELYVTGRNHLTFTWSHSVIKSKEAVLVCVQDAWEGRSAVDHKLSRFAKDHPEDGTKIESFHENLIAKQGRLECY